MGFIHGCNICNTPREIGEIETKDLNNNIIITKLSSNLLHLRQESTMTNIGNFEIKKVLTNISITTTDDIEFPSDIIAQILNKNRSLKHENIKYINGDTYDGTINKNNKKEGFGIYKTKNGYIYKSLWQDDKICDYSIFIDPEGNYIKGTIVNGDIGEGELLIKNKMKYIGEFLQRLPNNKGILYNFSEKFIYEGDFLLGEMDGKGIIKYMDGTCYEGDFKNDKYEGKGKITFKNGGSYEGEFNNNLINGKGKYIYPDGKIYEGDFRNGLKHGFGKIIWNENKYFEGYWINNKQHGEGKYYLNGKVLNAIFRYGKLIMKI